MKRMNATTTVILAALTAWIAGCSEGPEAEWWKAARAEAVKFPYIAGQLAALERAEQSGDTSLARTFKSSVDLAMQLPDTVNAIFERLDVVRRREGDLILEATGWEEMLGRWEEGSAGRQFVKAKIDSLDVLISEVGRTVDGVIAELVENHGASENLRSLEPLKKRGGTVYARDEAHEERNRFMAGLFNDAIASLNEKAAVYGAVQREADSLLALAIMLSGSERAFSGFEEPRQQLLSAVNDLAGEARLLADSVRHYGGEPLDFTGWETVQEMSAEVLEDVLSRPAILIEERSVRSRSGRYWQADGTVRNFSDQSISYGRVTIRFYDANDVYLGMNWSYLDDTDLAPGERTTFEVLEDVQRAVKHTLSFTDGDGGTISVVEKG